MPRAHSRKIQVYSNKNADGPPWVVAEVIDTGTSADEPETLSDQWVDLRLEQAVGEQTAHQVRLEGYTRWELRVDPSGEVDRRDVPFVE